jgi:hypothetical protein
MRRLVLCGPAIAGKTTILHAFASSRALSVRRFEPNSGSGEVRDRGVSVVDDERQLEVTTVCGVVWNDDTWSVVLAGADALALVLDLQATRAQADREFAEAVALIVKAPSLGCVIWTKGDLIADGVEESVPRTLLAGTRAEAWPSFVARHDNARTLVEPIEWLVAQINDGDRR